MSNSKFAILLTVVILAIAASTFYIIEKNKVEYPDNLPVENMEVDSQNVVENVTIDDILQARKDILQCQYYDSVFLHMPDISLIAVLMKLGTDATNTEIAKEYLNNRKIYDNVQLGAQIKDMYKKQFEPDSLPNKPKPDSIAINISDLFIF